MMPTRRTFLALSLLTLALTGCGSGSGSGSPAARVRVVPVSPDAAAMDIQLNNKTKLTNLSYKTSSSYVSVPGDLYNVKANTTSGGTNLISTDLLLLSGTDSTLLLMNRLDQLTPLRLIDDNTAPLTGNFRLRLVHAAPSLSNVDIYLTTTETLPFLYNFAFLMDSTYENFPAGTYRVRATVNATTDIVVESPPLSLAAGQIRTVVLVGDPSLGQPLEFLVLSDN